jgi:aminoglycoside phosphotransferase (APT) family kinase protein
MRKPLNHQSLDALIQTLVPGGRLVRARRLRGGLGSWMDVLTLEGDAQVRTRLVLRRFNPEHRFSAPDDARYEFRLLRFLQRVGVPAPRPLLLDSEAEYFGVPAMVLSYLPGRPLYELSPANLDELARGIRQVHSITPVDHDLSWLRVRLQDGMREELVRRREQASDGEPLAREALSVLENELDAIEFLPPCLTHDDFWPGNTVWNRGSLMGIIDWTMGCLGDPRSDVAQCRLDLLLTLGEQGADDFLASYGEASGRSLPGMWYFDLFRGLRALLYYRSWLSGYRDDGLDLDPDTCGDRIRTFVRRILRSQGLD